MTMLTKGTHIFILDPRNNQITKLACPKGLTGLSLSTPQISATCLDSEAEEFSPGMPSPGAATIAMDFDTAVASHMLLEDLNANQVTAKWAVGYSDGTAPPTVDSSGDFSLPTSRSWIVFSAYVADIPMDFALNSNVTSSIGVQPSGRRQIIAKVASV
jgi:hypothetical protein